MAVEEWIGALLDLEGRAGTHRLNPVPRSVESTPAWRTKRQPTGGIGGFCWRINYQ